MARSTGAPAALRRTLPLLGLIGLTVPAGAQTLHYGASAGGFSNALTVNNQTGVPGPFNHSTNTAGGALHASATDAESNASHLEAADVLYSPTGNAYPVTFQADDTATFTGKADLGALHATAQAVSELTPLTATVQGYDDNGDPFSVSAVNPLQAYGAGDMALSWQDIFTITPTAATPFGSAVDLQASLHFDGSISATKPADLVNVSTDVFFDPVARYPNDQDPYLFTLYGAQGAFDKTQSQTLHVLAGYSYIIGSDMDVHVGSDTGDGRYASKVGLDQTLVSLGDTSAFTLSVLTPGASYTTESGHLYSPAVVPEPSSLTLLGLGAAGLMLKARRRKPVA